MGVGLPPLEFTECMTDSPTFRDNLHQHERELEKTNQQIKRIIKEVKDLLNAAKQLSNAQRSFANGLEVFTFECIGGTQTDDEQVICSSLNEFGKLIHSIEDERERMLDNVYSHVVKPLEDFRKKYIGGVKNEKKKFEKQTAKFCQCQERYLNMTTKKQNHLQEADASVDMAERHFYTASMEYVYLIQEVHERKKFEFVETLLTFVFGWLTFYHQGYEVAKDFGPYRVDLQQKIQKTRSNFDDYSNKLRKRMADVQRQYLEGPSTTNAKGCKEGYLFLLEKKAFGTTWTKHFCTFDKETREFSMVPYNQLTTKSMSTPDTMVLSSCVRRMSDSIEKRFCFDIQSNSKPGVVFTFQALSEHDRLAWMNIMDGKEPTYSTTNNIGGSTAANFSATGNSLGIKMQNHEERQLDDTGIQFIRRCIEVLESRGLEEQGIYRVVGVTSKVNKLLSMGLDRRKGSISSPTISESQPASSDGTVVKVLPNLDDPQEWETKTITSALKCYLRNLSEPLMTYRYHNGFIAAVKNEARFARINDVHTLVYRLPKTNFEVLKILIRHLSNVATKCDKNLMTVSNLGVCFGPTLLRPEEETVASIMDLKFYNIVVEMLIENYEHIFNYEPVSEISLVSIDTYTSTASIHSNNVHTNQDINSVHHAMATPIAVIPSSVSESSPQPPSPPSAHSAPLSPTFSKSFSLHQPMFGTRNGGGTITPPPLPPSSCTPSTMAHEYARPYHHHHAPQYYHHHSTSFLNRQPPPPLPPPPPPPAQHKSLSSDYASSAGIGPNSALYDAPLSPTIGNLGKVPSSLSIHNVHHGPITNGNHKNSASNHAYGLVRASPVLNEDHSYNAHFHGSQQSLPYQPHGRTSHPYGTITTQQHSPQHYTHITLNGGNNNGRNINTTGSNHCASKALLPLSTIQPVHTRLFGTTSTTAISNATQSEIQNSASSSNESVSSTSRDDNTYVSSMMVTGPTPSTPTPKKSERSNSMFTSYPQGYRSQGNVRVRTLYACLGEQDGELSFEPNQIITNVRSSHEPGWLEGTLNGKTGLIPKNYVEMLP